MQLRPRIGILLGNRLYQLFGKSQSIIPIITDTDIDIVDYSKILIDYTDYNRYRYRYYHTPQNRNRLYRLQPIPIPILSHSPKS